MFKQGNQFYLGLQIEDNLGEFINIKAIDKIQFTIDNLEKIYDGVSKDVTYDEDKKCFKIWLTEDETFNFDKTIKIDVRVLYKEDDEGKKIIDGGYIISSYWYDALSKNKLDDGATTSGLNIQFNCGIIEEGIATITGDFGTLNITSNTSYNEQVKIPMIKNITWDMYEKFGGIQINLYVNDEQVYNEHYTNQKEPIVMLSNEMISEYNITNDSKVYFELLATIIA